MRATRDTAVGEPRTQAQGSPGARMPLAARLGPEAARSPSPATIAVSRDFQTEKALQMAALLTYPCFSPHTF